MEQINLLTSLIINFWNSLPSSIVSSSPTAVSFKSKFKKLQFLSNYYTFNKRGGQCFCPRSFVCLSVCLCLSVSKITQKRVHGFG